MTAVEAEAWQKIKKWPYSGREDKTVNHLLDTNAGDTVPLRIVIKETSSPDMVARLEHGESLVAFMVDASTAASRNLKPLLGVLYRRTPAELYRHRNGLRCTTRDAQAWSGAYRAADNAH